MSTETILSDKEILAYMSKIFGHERASSFLGGFALARAIEQAVLQSPEVQKLERDKETLLSALVYAEKVLCEQEDALRRFGVAEEDQESELAILGAREAIASVKRGTHD